MPSHDYDIKTVNSTKDAMRRLSAARKIARVPKGHQFSIEDTRRFYDAMESALTFSKNENRSLVLNIMTGFMPVWSEYYSIGDTNRIFFCFLCSFIISSEIKKTKFPIPSRFMMDEEVISRVFDHVSAVQLIVMILEEFHSENMNTLEKRLLRRNEIARLYDRIVEEVQSEFRSRGL